MAKESMKAREVKRQRMVAKYAERKAALKKAPWLMPKATSTTRL